MVMVQVQKLKVSWVGKKGLHDRTENEQSDSRGKKELKYLTCICFHLLLFYWSSLSCSLFTLHLVYHKEQENDDRWRKVKVNRIFHGNRRRRGRKNNNKVSTWNSFRVLSLVPSHIFICLLVCKHVCLFISLTCSHFLSLSLFLFISVSLTLKSLLYFIVFISTVSI